MKLTASIGLWCFWITNSVTYVKIFISCTKEGMVWNLN